MSIDFVFVFATTLKGKILDLQTAKKNFEKELENCERDKS